MLTDSSKYSFIYKDILWNVIPHETDQHTGILNSLFSLTENSLQLSSRLFAIRMDFRLSAFTPDNSPMTRFQQAFIPALRKKYPKTFINYAWVREQDKSDAQHYHYVLILNGHHVCYAQPLVDLMAELWETTTGGIHWLPKNPWYKVNRGDIDSQASFIKRISYFGKKRSKARNPAGVKSYETGIRKSERYSPSTTIGKKPSSQPEQKTTMPDNYPHAHELQQKRFAGWKDEELNWFNTYSLNTISLTTGKNEPDIFKHRQNYLQMIVNYNISPAKYADEYDLPRWWVYKNLRDSGAEIQRLVYWELHRSTWHLQCKESGKTAEEYVKENNLPEKTAIRRLKQRKMNAYWREHFDLYYTIFWPLGTSVAFYCELHSLKPSTARRYLINLPQGIITPFVIRHLI
ncbi:inovirus-type Gp2 protein [Erwinia sp. MMLR14_017]|uniref:YagK/YfjJ domain-containing protein n=1 Tax=Erwinia sp. MMLR14_017 TaxID=3093842 RepID=UPI00298F792D|nr:inovirus-type Gp2 protein [Erwinia sp. MMLR14_017]MDW8844610.1 inovirus-type Gp2 protein [Erwinia sp. MMLR14_017]